jgi:hypothetical protein
MLPQPWSLEEGYPGIQHVLVMSKSLLLIHKNKKNHQSLPKSKLKARRKPWQRNLEDEMERILQLQQQNIVVVLYFNLILLTFSSAKTEVEVIPDNEDVSSETSRSASPETEPESMEYKIAHELHVEINGVEVSNNNTARQIILGPEFEEFNVFLEERLRQRTFNKYTDHQLESATKEYLCNWVTDT